MQQAIKLHWFKLIGVCCPRTKIRKCTLITLPCFIFQIETPSVTLGPFCGHTPPPSPLLTHSHDVKVHFTSDGFGTNKGFSLRFRVRGAEMRTPVSQTGNQLLLTNLVCYRLQSVLTFLFFHVQTAEKVCPAMVTPHSTTSPENPEHHPGQTAIVKCDIGYVVNTVSMQCHHALNLMKPGCYQCKVLSSSMLFCSFFLKKKYYNVLCCCWRHFELLANSVSAKKLCVVLFE